MEINELFQNYLNVINGKNNDNDLQKLEKKLSFKIPDLIEIDEFFKIPLENIFSIISNTKLFAMEDYVTKIQAFITKTVEAHFEEKETILLLQKMNFEKVDLTYYEIVSILESFSNCYILTQLGLSYASESLDIDYQYVIDQKDSEIQTLKDQLSLSSKKIITESFHFEPVTSKPDDFEQDILKACKSDKYIKSVQYLIEQQKVDPLKRNAKKETLLHIAVQNGALRIVQYLIENRGVDVEITDRHGFTPLHTACYYTQLEIVQYLIEHANANKNAKATVAPFKGWTPLHIACQKGSLPIIQYLIEKALVDKNALTDKNWTALHTAASYNMKEVIKYLISQGFDKNAKDNSGKIPFDYASKPECKELLEVQQ